MMVRWVGVRVGLQGLQTGAGASFVEPRVELQLSAVVLVGRKLR